MVQGCGHEVTALTMVLHAPHTCLRAGLPMVIHFNNESASIINVSSETLLFFHITFCVHRCGQMNVA